MKRQNCYRDITIGEIGEEHIGRTVRAAAQERLGQAPGEVTEQRLREVHIRVRD